MRYSEAIDILFGLESFGVKLGLHNITALADRLGDPQKQFKIIHVAGTNGKGTVCSSLAAVLSTAGYKTGLFTSPHLLDYRERIRVDGQRIPCRVVSSFIAKHQSFIRERRITFFETTTAMAFDWFARSGCDVAVLEVGLGGRLDATNIVDPTLTVITSIDLDHTKTLGRTRRRIAAEKAGIVKTGVPVVCGPMVDTAREAIAAIAEERSAPFVDSTRSLRLQDLASPGAYAISANGTLPSRIQWRYPGDIHRDNLTTTLAALTCLPGCGVPLTKRAIRDGLASASWPGRFQTLPGQPLTIFDVAHNAAAAHGLADSLSRIRSGRRVVAVCAIAKDKRWQSMIRTLSPLVDEWFFTRFPNRRAWRLGEVRKFAKQSGLRFRASRDPQRMYREARAGAGSADMLLVFGSHFLVGRVLPSSAIDPAPVAENPCPDWDDACQKKPVV